MTYKILTPEIVLWEGKYYQEGKGEVSEEEALAGEKEYRIKQLREAS